MNRTLAIIPWLGLLATGGLRAGAQTAAPALEARSAPARPAAAPPDRVAQIREQHLPNIELITHEGRKVRFYDDLVKGRVVAINFMYANCGGVCLPSTAHLVQVQKALGERMGREVTFLSISLDSEDTPAVLKQYAQNHDVGPGWYFLTGNHEDIERLRHKLGVYELDPVLDADRTQHATLVILGNEPKGRWQSISALANPVRIRQAIERTMLPPNQARTDRAAVNEVPFEMSQASLARVKPVDSSRLPATSP